MPSYGWADIGILDVVVLFECRKDRHADVEFHVLVDIRPADPQPEPGHGAEVAGAVPGLHLNLAAKRFDLGFIPAIGQRSAGEIAAERIARRRRAEQADRATRLDRHLTGVLDVVVDVPDLRLDPELLGAKQAGIPAYARTHAELDARVGVVGFEGAELVDDASNLGAKIRGLRPVGEYQRHLGIEQK